VPPCRHGLPLANALQNQPDSACDSWDLAGFRALSLSQMADVYGAVRRPCRRPQYLLATDTRQPPARCPSVDTPSRRAHSVDAGFTPQAGLPLMAGCLCVAGFFPTPPRHANLSRAHMPRTCRAAASARLDADRRAADARADAERARADREERRTDDAVARADAASARADAAEDRAAELRAALDAR
jgi:hypothetical protein